MRPLVVAVVPVSADSDPGPALASIAATRRYVARPRDVVATGSIDAEVLVVDAVEREAVAAVLRAGAPDAVAVVLASDERLTPELARRLETLAAEPPRAARWTARVRLRFLGEEIESGREVIAWTGDPDPAAAPVELDASVVRHGADVTASIVALDAEATRLARERATADVADFFWWPAWRLLRRLCARRRHGIPGVVLSVLETYREVLIAAKAWERLSPATGRMAPAGFHCVETPGGFAIISDGAPEGIARVLLAATPEEAEGEVLATLGRGPTWRVRVGDAGPAVLRWYRRGGLVRWWVRDRFFGWRWRPLAELTVTEAARARGVAVPEVLAARVDRLALGWYRGALVTREIIGARALADVLRAHPDEMIRAPLLLAVARALRTMHDQGIHHRDLNAGNLLVTGDLAAPTVWIIDFDRARVLARLSRRRRRRALRRLRRSLVKLERAGVLCSAGDRSRLERAYWQA